MRVNVEGNSMFRVRNALTRNESIDVWSEADLDHILGKYGLMAVSRAGSDVDSFSAVSLILSLPN